MTEQEFKQRASVVERAQAWLGTPYHHRGSVFGGGVDCAWLLIRVFEEAGVIPKGSVDPGFYRSGMAAVRRGETMYKRIVSQLAVPVEGRDPVPGDIVLFRFVHATHGGIVAPAWPRVIHAFQPYRAVVSTDVEREGYLKNRVDSFWAPRVWSS